MRTWHWFVSAICMCALAGQAQGVSSSIHGTNKWAWAENSGWVNCRADITNGTVIGEYVCSGYMWSEGTGWIHMGNGTPTNGIQYTNNGTNDYGVNHNGEGDLRGYAWCESAGWINFESNGAPRVDLETGYVSGYAWGGSLGWISFSNVMAFTETMYVTNAADSDADGIADAWELTYTGATNAMGGTNDWDGDGVTDYHEYLAGTSPIDSRSYFSVSSFTLDDGGNVCLTWTWEPTRLYRVEELDDLADHPGGWTESALGLMYNDETSNVTVELPVASTQKFYRAVAVKPLSF